MPVTIREYLGDEKIAQLEGMGFLPNLIADMAKRQYMQDRQAKRNELADSGLDGKLVQGIMRKNINEEEARNAQKFEDFGAKKHGWGLGAAKTVAGIANAAERVSDLVNPFYEGKRDEKGNYIYQNAIEKGLRPKIKSAEKLRDDYEKATGETSWGSRAAEIGTEMVADPINFVGGLGLLSKGSKLAQFGKKSLFFAGTGAASGGVMALGEGRNDEETLKNMTFGAVGGFVLGHAIDQGIQGIGKLIAKRRANRAANEADAIESAENSEFIGGDRASGTKITRDEADDIAETMTVREFATSEAGLDEATAAKVVKEAAQGKEKSDFVDADTYADIVKFKNFENQRDYARAYGEQIEAAKQSLNNAREQSAVRYAETQKAINEYQRQGMPAGAVRELVNTNFKPSADEINYTRAYNDGADVDPRLAGQGIFYALEKDIAAQAYTPEIYAARLKQRGFSDESAEAFSQAYVSKDINIAKEYANAKVAEKYEAQIREEAANEIKVKNEIDGEGWTMKDGGEAKADYVIKTDLAPNVRDLSKITTDEISADLEYLAGKHPEIFDKPSDVFRLIKEIKENPTHFFTNNRLDYALIVKRLKNNKIGKLAIDKQSGEVRHATKVKDKDLKRLAKVSEEKSENAGIIQTFTRPGSKLENQGLGYQDETIIPQKGNLVNEKANGLSDSVSSVGDNASRASGRQGSDEQILRQGRRDTSNASQTKRSAQGDKPVEQRRSSKADGANDASAAGEQVVEKQAIVDLRKDYDVDRFLRDRENVSAKDAKYGSKIAQKSDLVTRWDKNGRSYEYIPPLKEKNHNADFLTTKADVAKIRSSRADEATINKLRSDLRDSEHLGYDYKTTDSELRSAYKDENIDWSAKPHGMKDDEYVNDLVSKGKAPILFSNAHLGSGLVAGTLNSVDEDGNFSPERFAAGFLAGLAGSKAASVTLKKVAPKLYENLTNTAKSFSDKGIKEIRSEIEKLNGITPIKEFGENYAEFYHNGKGAIQKLLKEKKGQVAGAFYREDIGDVTLPWGEVFRKGEKIKGYGVAKIIEKHGKEILNKLPKIFETGNLIKQNDVHYRIESGNYVVGLSSEFKGEKHNFVLTAFERNERKTDIFTDPSFRAASDDLATNSDKGIIPQNPNDAASNLPKPEDIIAKHPNVERELDESITAMRKESFNDSNFKAELMGKFDTKEITTQELGKSVNLSDKQLAVLKNDIKNADFKVISDSKIYFDKIGKDGDKKRFFVDIAEDGSLRVDAYAKSQIDNIPVKQSALEELADAGDSVRLKNMSFEVKAAYRNELDPIKKEAILKTAELNKLKKAAQGGDKAAVAKFEEFKAKNLDEDGNIKDGLELC